MEQVAVAESECLGEGSHAPPRQQRDESQEDMCSSTGVSQGGVAPLDRDSHPFRHGVKTVSFSALMDAIGKEEGVKDRVVDHRLACLDGCHFKAFLVKGRVMGYQDRVADKFNELRVDLTDRGRIRHHPVLNMVKRCRFGWD